ncbi:MAG: hypothetical protein R2780_03350 [Crocinitomicaceae bacterium]
MKYYIENKNSTVSVNEEGIFIIQWKANERLEIDDFKTVVDIFAEWSQGEPWKVLHVFPKGASASGEARNYGATREKKTSAEAFVIENVIHRNLFRLYQRFRSKLYPIRAFSDLEDAKEWLLEVEIVQQED